MAPAFVEVGSVGDVDLVSEVPSNVSVPVSNTGGQASGEVVTEFSFPTGVTWVVSTVGSDAPWTCILKSADVERCSTPDLAADATSTLTVAVSITDGALDGARDVALGIRTWAPGLGEAPAPTSIWAHLTSSPARITASDAAPVELLGNAGEPVTKQVSVPISNDGGTSVPVHATVILPTDLPSGVSVAGAGAWACTNGAGVLECDLPSLPRGATVPLLLDVTASTGLADADLATALAIIVPAANITVVAPLTIQSASAVLDVTVPATTTLERGKPRVVTFTVTNSGQTTARNLAAAINLPADVSWDGLAVANDWTCAERVPGSNTTATCTLASLAPGATSTLQVAVHATGNATGRQITATVDADGLAQASAATTLQVVASSLAFSPAVTAYLVHDASGPIAFGVTNTGTASASGVTATVTVPRAVTLDPIPAVLGEGQNWACVKTTEQVATCTLATLAPGDVAPLVLYATANGATSDAVVVEVADGSGADAAVITSSVSLRLASAGLSVRYQTTGAFSVAQIGAPLLGCDLKTQLCRDAMNALGGSAANNDYAMVPLTNAVGEPIDSVANLVIPSDRQIAFAGLYWSANKSASDPDWTGPRNTIKLRAPGATRFTDVQGDVIAEVIDNSVSPRSYYQSFADVTADVTAAVQAGETGYWAANGAAVSASRNDPDHTYYAGWALVVVYADPAGGNVTVFDGGAWVATDQSTTFAFAAAENRNARVGVVAWEGDRNGGGGGDALKLNTTPALTPLMWDGSAGLATDAFNSTATGSVFKNSLGTDAKAFAPAPLLDGINRLAASTVGDQYLLGVVTLTTTPH